jgi:hypothetical protein
VEGLFEKDTFNDWKQKASELATGDFQDFSFGYREDTAFDELKFKFPSIDKLPAERKAGRHSSDPGPAGRRTISEPRS